MLVDQQGYVLSTEQQVADQLGRARTAIDEVNEWVQMGRTGPQIDDALNNSLLAINTLTSQPFWYMPDVKNPGGTVFDPRMALVAYLASLTARVGVLTLYNPNFRSITEYTDEFATQLQWMKQIQSWMTQRVSCSDGFQLDSGPIQWGVCSQCTDPNTQYLS